MSGSVTLTPLIDTGDSLPAPTLTPPANLWLVPIKAQIKSGVITSNGVAGVKLVANTAVLGLTGDLYYRVDFYDGLLAGGKTYHPDPFSFLAPTTAATVDLVTVTPVPGVPATGPAGTIAWNNVSGKPGIVGLVQAAKNPDLLVTGAITVDGNDLVTSAAVVWPDGSPGTLTITSRDTNSAVLAYNITYGSPVTKTYTQPTITRNTNGAATNVPAIVVI
jgi:hypothetical protein